MLLSADYLMHISATEPQASRRRVMGYFLFPKKHLFAYFGEILVILHLHDHFTSPSPTMGPCNRENREFVFILIVQFMMSANIRKRFWLAYRTRLLVQYTITLSSLCKLI